MEDIAAAFPTEEFPVADIEYPRLSVCKDEPSTPVIVTFPPDVFDAADATMWLREEAGSLLRLLRRRGAVLLRACPINGPRQFEALCRAVTPDLLDYRGGGALRSVVAGKIYNSTEYAADQSIPLHCESTYYPDVPAFIWFYCAVPALEGGETPVGDMARVLERLDPELVDRFERRGLRYIYNMHGGDGFGRSWMDAFQTADPEIVEAWLETRRIAFRWNARRSLHVELEAPVLRSHPVSGVTVWGNQAANWHIASLAPATAMAIRRFYKSEAEYPKHVLFADGEPIPAADIRHILQVLAAEEHAAPWGKGDILLCDNFRMAHGRRPFTGERRVLVAMA